MRISRHRIFTEEVLFYALVLFGLIPLFFTKYFLTLDGASHVYNGTIIRELLLGRHPFFSELFRLNPFPVPNWISHFLFATLGTIFPGYLSEKIVLAIYLILFPIFFRKIVLWAKPNNQAFSYLGILFAHNHLLYLGSYNLLAGITVFMGLIFYVATISHKTRLKEIAILSLLFLVIYLSHILIFLIALAVSLLLAFAFVKIEWNNKKLKIDGLNRVFPKLKLIGISIFPALVLSVFYVLRVDSLEEAGHLQLKTLLDWIIDIRPLLPLCYCTDRKYFTHGLSLLFLLMIIFHLYTFIKTASSPNGKFRVNVLISISTTWFLVFICSVLLFFVVPNANILPERLILILFIFLSLWISSLRYPTWIHKATITLVVIIHLSFMYYHTLTMRRTSKEVESMIEATKHISPGSLFLPFNYAYDQEWRHMHSSGYLGSSKQIVVLDNYEAQLKWFPVNWKIDGKYELSPINVWAADNKKMVKSFYQNPQNPDVFSLPLKDGKIQEIPYVVIFGAQPDETNSDFALIKSILEKSYTLTFQNGFCYLYKLGK